MDNHYIGLQFFADAGTLVNTTTQYVNAYDGSVTPFDQNGNSLTPTMKEFYDTALLENARVQRVYAQFAKKQPLPKNHGGTVEWRKFNTFKRADKLVEGVIPSGQKFGLTKLTGSVDQYGTYTTISDRLEMRAYDPVIMEATEEMGASGAETQEVLIRDALYAGTNVLYCDKITKATGAVAASPTAEKDLYENSTYGCHLTPTMINKAVTIMKKNRVPQINNRYYAVIHPSVTYDLREHKDWIDAHKYASPEQLFNGEIGELHGVRFIENSFAPVIRAADLSPESHTLKLATATTSGTAVTSVVFSTDYEVAANALKDRYISLGGVIVKVTSNTASSGTHTITVASTDFGTNSVGALIYPAEHAAEGVACYATYLFGKDSFGIIDPEGGGMEMIVKDKGTIGGPLEQFSTVGYKFESNGATLLYPERMLRIMSTSSDSEKDEAN